MAFQLEFPFLGSYMEKHYLLYSDLVSCNLGNLSSTHRARITKLSILRAGNLCLLSFTLCSVWLEADRSIGFVKDQLWFLLIIFYFSCTIDFWPSLSFFFYLLWV